jgi:hypothetical protein
VGTARASGGLLTLGLVLATGCARGGDGNDGAFDEGGVDGASVSEAALADALSGSDSADGSVEDASGDAGALPETEAGSSEGSLDDAPVSGDSASGDSAGGDSAGGDSAGALPPPIGQWTFDEGAGPSSADLSGHGHAAVLSGGASWATSGKEGTGLALDGVTGYADVGVTLVDTTASFSVLSWANLAAVGSWEVVLSEDDVTGSLFGLKLRGDGSQQFDFDVETSDVTTPPFIVAQSTSVAQANTWVHLAGVYDAGGSGALKVYVNGALQANASVGKGLPAATGHFLIGRGLYNGVTGSYVDGTLDEVAVYGVALTDAQVAAVYAVQK